MSSPALHGRLETVALLLERCGYGVDGRDSSGVTPLMDAARGNHLDVIQCLLDKGKVSNNYVYTHNSLYRPEEIRIFAQR